VVATTVRTGRQILKAILQCHSDPAAAGEDRARLFWDEQPERGKVISQIAAISREQTIGMHCGVRADQKVRDNASLLAAASKISRENLTGEQSAFLRRWNKTQLPVGEKFVDLGSIQRYVDNPILVATLARTSRCSLGG